MTGHQHFFTALWILALIVAGIAAQAGCFLISAAFLIIAIGTALISTEDK